MRLPPALVLARFVARTNRAALVAHLVPRWVVWLLVVVELEVIVDFARLQRALAAAPAPVAGGFVAVWTLLFALSERKAAASLLFGQQHALLWRQPLDGAQWGPAAMTAVAPLAAPMGLSAAFWYGPWAVAPIVAWLALGSLVVALGGSRSPLWALPAALLAGVVATGLHAVLAAGWPFDLLAVAMAAALVAGVTPLAGVVALRLRHGPTAAPRTVALRPRTPLWALLWRDLLALWRTERAVVWSATIGGMGLGAVARGMHVNGQFEGRILTQGALIGLAVIGGSALTAPSTAARALGRRFDPPEWPTTALQRALSLALVAAGTLAPGWAAAAATAPPIGVEGNLRIGAFVASVGAGAAWWVASRPGRPNPGTWPYWLGLCLVCALAPWGALASGVLAAGALSAGVRCLEQRRKS